MVILIYIVAQVNIWRVLGVSGLRGQDIANKVLPGLGIFIAIIVCIRGLAFNIGNVAGAGMAFNVFGMNVKIGAAFKCHHSHNNLFSKRSRKCNG